MMPLFLVATYPYWSVAVMSITGKERPYQGEWRMLRSMTPFTLLRKAMLERN